VQDDGFAVSIDFGENPNALYPYDAIKTFVDPSVDFRLRFEDAIAAMTNDETMRNGG